MKDKCEYRCEQVLKFFPARLSEEWASDYCLMPSEQFFGYIIARTSYIFFNEMMMSALYKTNNTLSCFLMLAHRLKQQVVGRHVTAFRHIIILILRQPGFALQYISITLRSCPTYDIDPKIHTIVSNHIWAPSLDLFQVSWTYGFSKTKVQLYMTRTNIIHVRSW